MQRKCKYLCMSPHALCFILLTSVAADVILQDRMRPSLAENLVLYCSKAVFTSALIRSISCRFLVSVLSTNLYAMWYLLAEMVTIRITCPCNEHPLTPHFYIEKVGFTRVYIFFFFLLQNIDCGYSLEPPR